MLQGLGLAYEMVGKNFESFKFVDSGVNGLSNFQNGPFGAAAKAVATPKGYRFL